MGLAPILMLAFAQRAGLPITAFLVTGRTELFHSADSASYVDVARSLATEGQYARHGVPDAHRPPGYPVLLLPGVILGAVEPITIALQILLGCATVFLVFRIALELFGRADVARVAALLIALDPVSIRLSSMILSETAFTFVNTLFLLALCTYLRTRSTRDLWRSAAVLAATIYVRPINYFLPALVALALLVEGGASANWRRAVGHAILLFALAMGLVGAWQVRNAAVAGTTEFSDVAASDLYFYEAASVVAAKERRPFREVQREMGFKNPERYFERHPEQRSWTLAERDRFLREEAVRTILGSPLTYAKLHAKAMLRALFDPGAIDLLRALGFYPRSGGMLGVVMDRGIGGALAELAAERPFAFGLTILLSVEVVALLGFAAFGLASRGFVTTGTVALLGVAAYLWVLGGVAFAGPRFRLPLLPVLSIAAGYGILRARELLRRPSVIAIPRRADLGFAISRTGSSKGT